MGDKVYGWGDLRPVARDYLRMEKDVASGAYSQRWPSPGGKISVELISEEDRSLRFFMDVTECRRSSSVLVGIRADRKSTMQTRCSDAVLLRVDYAEQSEALRHRNPDGSIVVGTHVHLDLDGNGARWAFPLDSQDIIVPSGGRTVPELFWAFQDACNITRSLRVEHSLGV